MTKAVRDNVMMTILGVLLTTVVGLIATTLADVSDLRAQVTRQEVETTNICTRITELQTKVDDIHWYLIGKGDKLLDKR